MSVHTKRILVVRGFKTTSGVKGLIISSSDRAQTPPVKTGVRPHRENRGLVAGTIAASRRYTSRSAEISNNRVAHQGPPPVPVSQENADRARGALRELARRP